MNRKRTALLASLVATPLLVGGFVFQERATADGARLFGQVLDLVSSRFVDTVDTGMLYEKAARGLVGQLQDPYSELMSPSQLRSFNSNTGGRYGGLGMSIEEQQGKGITVAKVFHNTPAERAGIREGDVIALVDTVSTRGWTSKGYYGIDQGPVVLMIENYRSGLVWRLMGACPSIVNGLRRAGFTGGWLGSAL